MNVEGGAEAAGLRTTISRSLAIDLESELWQFVAKAGVQEVSFAPVSGVGDFGFVNSLTARLVSSTLPHIEIASYVGRYGWVTIAVTSRQTCRLALELIDASYERVTVARSKRQP